ncbi:MAG: PUA domain-containing protein [Promethearchaeota archaeon]
MYVNDKGEKAILYGNIILKKMITNIHVNLKKKDFLLVFNQLNELIAIAQSQVDFEDIQNLEPNKSIAINLVDKGYYLRKKQ